MYGFSNNKIVKSINFQTQDPKYALAQETHVLKVERVQLFLIRSLKRTMVLLKQMSGK